MALCNCPECKKEISDTVKKCPHCGYSLKTKRIRKKVNIKKIALPIGGAILLVFFAVVLFTVLKPIDSEQILKGNLD